VRKFPEDLEKADDVWVGSSQRLNPFLQNIYTFKCFDSIDPLLLDFDYTRLIFPVGCRF